MAPPSDPATADRRTTEGNGHVPPQASVLVGARPPGPSTRPALLVLGIIFVLFVVAAVGAGLSGSSRPTPAAGRAPVVVPGTGGLVAVPARPVLAGLVTSAGPPADVLAALSLPRATVAVPGTAAQHGLGLFDATVDVQVPATEQSVITFLRAELRAGKWKVVHAAPSGNAGDYQFIAQHPGSDGYEWETGLTVSPSVFSSAVPGVEVPAGGATPVSIRLFAISDQS